MNEAFNLLYWLKVNNIEVTRHNVDAAGGKIVEVAAILHEQTEPGIFKPYARMTGTSTKDAVQGLCDKCGILSFWEIQRIKFLLKIKLQS